MGIFATIQAKKEKFVNATVEMRKKAILKETEKVRADNIRQDDLLKARQELESARTINQDLRAGSPKAPSKLAVFGKNLKAHMDKQKAKSKGKPMIGVPQSRQQSQFANQQSVFGGSSQGGQFGGARNIEVGGGGSPFSGQRNLDVGGTGGSPFNMGGQQQVAKKVPQKKIVIYQ